MPELPEVETTVKGLKPKVLKRTFVDVWSDWNKTVKKPKDFEQFKKDSYFFDLKAGILQYDDY